MRKVLWKILMGLGSLASLAAMFWLAPRAFCREPGVVVLCLVTLVSWAGFTIGGIAVDD